MIPLNQKMSSSRFVTKVRIRNRWCIESSDRGWFELLNIDIADEGKLYYSTNSSMAQISEELTNELVGRCH